MTQPQQALTREQKAMQLPSPFKSDIVMIPLELLPAYLRVHGLEARRTSKIVINKESYPLLCCEASQKEKG
jgi:hypothetical protein